MQPLAVYWLLYLRLLTDVEGVFHLDPEVSDDAFELGVSEQALDSPEVLCSLVDQRGFCAPQPMGPIHRGVGPDCGYPRRDAACILTGRDMRRST